jgi:hypothetical protein
LCMQQIETDEIAASRDLLQTAANDAVF